MARAKNTNANVSTDNITLAEVETSEVVNTVTEVETVAEVETNKVIETVTESVSDETSDPVFWVSFDLDVHKTNGIANAEFAIIANNKEQAVYKAFKVLAPVYGLAIIEPSVSVIEIKPDTEDESSVGSKPNVTLLED